MWLDSGFRRNDGMGMLFGSYSLTIQPGTIPYLPRSHLRSLLRKSSSIMHNLMLPRILLPLQTLFARATRGGPARGKGGKG